MVMKATLMLMLIVMSACSAPAVVWPSAVTCAQTEAGPVTSDVSAILVKGGPDMSASLEALAAQHGADFIVCVIESLISKWESARAIVVNTAQLEAAQRGRDFLATHHVSVVSP